MKLKFLALILVVFASLQSQAQTHMRTHEKNKTIFGLPIADIDSVKLTSTSQLVYLKGNPGVIDSTALSNIDSVTHAVPVTNSLYNRISGDASLSQLKTGVDRGNLNPYPLGLSGNMTVFAPVNTGLADYGIVPSNLSAGANEAFIAYHTIQGKHTLASIPTGENTKYFTMNVPTDSVFITKFIGPTSGRTFVYVNGVQVDTTSANINLASDNGLLHKLTPRFGVIFPPVRNIYDEINKTTYSANAFRYDSIAKLVARAAIANPKIIDTLKNEVLTLLTPSNAAITSFLSGFGGSINNVPPAAALSLLRDHMIIGRKFLINFQLATTTGLPAYGGSNVKYATSGQTLVFYYNPNAAVAIRDFDYIQTNGVIQQINGVLTK